MAEGGAGPVLVHADVLRSRATIMPIEKPAEILPQHIKALEFIAATRTLLFPTFNYDYLTTGVFHPSQDRSQLGPLTEHARSRWAHWRLEVPVFNVVGQGTKPSDLDQAGIVDPFGSASVFSHLHSKGGDVLLYGTSLACMTAIHYVERVSGGPLYRYDKLFPGTVRAETGDRAICLLYHCRPRGKTLSYDFQRLADEAEHASALVRLRWRGCEVGFVRFCTLCDFWLERLKSDPLYLLDAASRDWVSRDLDRLGRRFKVADFE